MIIDIATTPEQIAQPARSMQNIGHPLSFAPKTERVDLRRIRVLIHSDATY